MVVPPSWNQEGDADLGENPALDEVSHSSFSSRIKSQSNVDPMAPEGSPKRSWEQTFALLPAPYAQQAETMPLQPNAAAKDREDYKLTGTSTDLSKKGNLEAMEKADLNAKIECGHCGEVQSPRPAKIRPKSTLKSASSRCKGTKNFHGDRLAPAGGTAVPRRNSSLRTKEKSIATAR